MKRWIGILVKTDTTSSKINTQSLGKRKLSIWLAKSNVSLMLYSLSAGKLVASMLKIYLDNEYVGESMQATIGFIFLYLERHTEFT